MREMKDSGVEWIGEIPRDWDICRLKNYAQIKNGQEYQEVLDDYGAYMVFGSGGAFARANRPLYCKESVLLGRKGTIDKPLYVSEPFWTVDTMYYTEIENGADGKYFYYLCTQIPFDYFLYGSAVPSMTQRDLSSIQFPLPSKVTQRRIANYLDAQCARIDRAIARQQEVIEKLKEYKLAVITEAVTKGLNPDVPMKDSGIEWIGEIPEHWSLTTIARIATVVRGASPRPAGDPRFFDGQDVPWITVAEVTKGEGLYISETESYLTDEGAKRSRLVESGTLLLSNSGATLGVPKISQVTGCINDGSVALLDLKIDQKFILFVLKSQTVELRRKMSGYGQPNLNTTIIKSIQIPMPLEGEQLGISKFLEEKCREIELVISSKQSIIDKLTEYKKSLIYEVVTGKREV